MPSLEKSNPLLHAAIKAVPVADLYRTIYDICATDPAVEKALASRFIISVDDDTETLSPGEKRKRDAEDIPSTRRSKRANTATGNPSQTKRPSKEVKVKGDSGRARTRWAKCRRCLEQFEVLKNENGACLYHPGMCLLFPHPFPLRTYVVLALLSFADIDVLGETEFDPDIGNGYWSYHNWETIDEEDQERWSCCQEIGSEEGCRTGKHKEIDDESSSGSGSDVEQDWTSDSEHDK